MKLVTDTYHTDSRKSHACLDFALAWIMDHMDMDGGLGLERPDWTDWTGVPETCLACISPHTHHTAADARPKKSHVQEYERVYSVPELVVGV